MGMHVKGSLIPCGPGAEAMLDAGRAFMARDSGGALHLVGSNPRGGVSLYWEYKMESAAWWLMVQDGNGVTASRAYGPFTALEASRAGQIHGVPFVQTGPVQTLGRPDERS